MLAQGALGLLAQHSVVLCDCVTEVPQDELVAAHVVPSDDHDQLLHE
jgi:hypothetical protein